MKEKTSITLSREVLAEIDRLAGDESRSGFIERVLRGYLGQRAREATNSRDLKRLNRAADRLNAEVGEVLEYQAPWPEE
ncbi:MAG: ribbon-helix-helix protein, CopG family [Gemmatimonadota bacterium]